MTSGSLIIISSPSGGGKGTLIREVRRRMSGIGLSVSYTTRQMRDGEENGREYHFVDRDRFEALIESGEFLEHALVHGNYYGTSVSQVRGIMDSGQDVILEIDVQGAGIIFGKMAAAVGIFILPPSYSVLKQRLTARATESPEELAVRLSNSLAEVQRFEEFTYVVINDDLERAVSEIETIINAERLRTHRQEASIKAILDSFEVPRT